MRLELATRLGTAVVLLAPVRARLGPNPLSGVNRNASTSTAPLSITSAPNLHKAKRTEPTTTSQTTTTWSPKPKNPPLYLPVTSGPPDPLGMSKVSGVYGPGTWAGWFLTLVGAWWRIIRASEEKLDPNTWAFLFGTNWAAVDILRSIQAVKSAATPEDARSKFGLYGAACSVVFWGIWHGIWQFVMTAVAFRHRDSRSRRLWTLIVGLAFPLIALQAVGFHGQKYQGSEDGFIPALYWHAMGQESYELVFLFASWTPVIIIPAALFWTCCLDRSKLPDPVSNFIHYVVGMAPKGFYPICLAITFPPWFISVIAWSISANSLWIIGIVPFSILLYPLYAFAMPCYWFAVMVVSCIVYVFNGYLHRGTRIAGSCFFMPCAPQSILDSDQLYPLIFGILSFFGFDVLPLVYKQLQEQLKKRQDNRVSIAQTADRLREHELRRISTVPSNGLVRRNTPGMGV